MTPGAEPLQLEARAVEAPLEALLAPEAEAWGLATEAVVPLQPTPLDRQPSAYVRAAWRDRPRGAVAELRLRALVGDGALAVRLSWAAERPRRLIGDVNVYADGCAVLFPADGVEAEFATMGSPDHPVRGWHWRAGSDAPFVVTARGLGTVERVAPHEVRVGADWTEGCWDVVLGRPLAAEGVRLERGSAVCAAFAVWLGAAGERAGLKSFSPRPCELLLAGDGA